MKVTFDCEILLINPDEGEVDVGTISRGMSVYTLHRDWGGEWGYCVLSDMGSCAVEQAKYPLTPHP